MAEVPESQEQYSGRPPGMAEVPESQEQYSGRPPGMATVKHCIRWPKKANIQE
jgi:hypothetical protein